LLGSLTVLEPLDIEHAEGLLPSASDPEVWRWKLAPRPTTVDEMRHIIIGSLLIGPDGVPRRPFVIRRRSDNAVIGSSTLYDLSLAHRCVEMGETWLDRSCWGQGYNEDAKHSLLTYCFGTLDVCRVAWRVDHLNLRSHAALRRLGFVYEGTLRSHRQRPDGSRRDSLYFSLLTEEWPANAAHLQQLIAARSTAGVRPPR
jgi:RimJ/RimL family protein N-acetyltransferase